MFSTGNETVDFLGSMNFSGNIIPSSWYRQITKENGKSYLLAIVILSDIVYWYRPVEVRDENSGKLTGFKKKFKADLLQRSYDDIAEQIGEEKQAVRRAVRKLEELGIIKTELRTITVSGKKINNVMFIDLNPEALYSITYPSDTPIIKNDNRLLSKMTTGSYQNCQQALIKFDNTNTKNTNTEITTKISSSSTRHAKEDSFHALINGFNALKEEEKITECKKECDFDNLRERFGKTADTVFEAVYALAKKRKCEFSLEIFESICETMVENMEHIKVPVKYAQQCYLSIVDDGRLLKPKIKPKPFSNLQLSSYSDADIEELEKNILAN